MSNPLFSQTMMATKNSLRRVPLLVGLLIGLLAFWIVGCGTSTSAIDVTSEATPPVAAAETGGSAEIAPAAAPAGRSVMPGGEMPATTATPTFKDVAYADVSATQKLDIYLPAGDGPFPVVVMVHGGGFMMGDKADGMGTAGVDQLLAAGYAAVPVNYRLSGEALAPAPIEDVKAAVRFLRANAQAYKLDPDHFGGWGASAGGNLVAMLGVSCGSAQVEGAELGNADQSSCVQAVVDWFGPTDFLLMDQQFSGTSCPQTHDAVDSPESMLVGGPIQENSALAQVMNPIAYVNGDAAPFFIQHGTADCNVPPQQSELLYQALVSAIGENNATFTLIDGAGHGGAQFWEVANLEAVIAFLDMHLK